FTYFDWNVSSLDAGGTTDTGEVFLNVTNGIAGKNVSIVLQHDTKGFSVAAVDDIIEWGLENGYVFLPLTPTSPAVHHNIAN
ncbi:MAG: peptidoglycan-N-acetylglucosamine deacetylase, partial [Clostridia bacterium]|nr:peptidoglycan-N-acetylglucosamine deacetylase [Clostridia bacterium]